MSKKSGHFDGVKTEAKNQSVRGTAFELTSCHFSYFFIFLNRNDVSRTTVTSLHQIHLLLCLVLAQTKS